MIKLLPFFNLNLAQAKKAYLRVWNNTESYQDLPLDPVKIKLHHFHIKEEIFKSASSLSLIIEYKNGSNKTFHRNKKTDWIFDRQNSDGIKNYLRQNKDSIYENSDFGKNTLLNILDACFEETKKIPKSTLGTKNLIYYSVGSDLSYLSLLETSVASILEKSSTKDFEFLFICPQSWQDEISSFSCLQNFPYHFHTIIDSNDGIEISKNKTRIYEFSGIDDFAKILFLDADIIAVKDVVEIFNDSLEENKLHTAYSEGILNLESHLKPYHGLCFLSEQRYKNICENNQIAFNAGQFLFLNSSRMRQHFYNLGWLMKTWPGEYFFEQSFMNHYFCGYNLTENSIFNSKVKIHSTTNQIRYNPEIKDTDVLIHFIAPALNAVAKSNFIKEYSNAYLL
jgi:lipopolysaccharide biosynthesis glycosyltransferase